MEEIKRGGKRLGAGRKPSGLKKKTISLYVPQGEIYKFGNEEKMKLKIYEFISSYGQQINTNKELKSDIQFSPITPQSFDAPLSFEKKELVTYNPVIPNQVVMANYWAEKKELTSEDYEKWVIKLENDPRLNSKQKHLIKTTYP